MTKTIVQALDITGQRGVINKGWGGLGNCESSFPPQSRHYSTLFLFTDLIMKHVVISVSQWQNQRNLCTYWTTVHMIGYSQDAVQWYQQNFLNKSTIVLNLN